MPSHNQTFEPAHAEEVRHLFAGFIGNDHAKLLYRASFSEHFAEDLRAIMEQVYLPKVIAEWKPQAR